MPPALHHAPWQMPPPDPAREQHLSLHDAQPRNPYGTKRLGWGLLGVVMILWDLVVLPAEQSLQRLYLSVVCMGSITGFMFSGSGDPFDRL